MDMVGLRQNKKEISIRKRKHNLRVDVENGWNERSESRGRSGNRVFLTYFLKRFCEFNIGEVRIVLEIREVW